MKYTKLPTTIEEQVEKLRSRGLRLNNQLHAQNVLANISYYRLRAYTFPFQDNLTDNHPFHSNVDFEKIVELYKFDRDLRLLIFDAIERIEIALRTQIIYQFSLTHGSHWQLNPALYRDKVRFINHLDSLQKEIERSTETFIEHYRNKYTDPKEPPSWMSLEVSSMGLLSKIFQNLLKSPEKQAITTHFGLKDISIIENWTLCFTTLRNICAHHGRVWNRRLIPIKLPKQPLYNFLNNREIYTNKLYAALACIEYVLRRISPDSTMKNSIRALMDRCPVNYLKEMGFPKNWTNEPFWN
jgi:abortive infection bacteriophage resistance protein